MQDGCQVFHWPVRVYHEDVDTMGIVYYANYLRFLERARTEWLRLMAIDQKVLHDETGIWLVVRSVDLDYRASARLDDCLDVTVTVAEQTKSSIVVEQTIQRDGQILLVGKIRIVSAREYSTDCGEKRLRPAPIPTLLSDAWKAYL